MKPIIKEIISKTNLSSQEAWWLLEHVTGKSKEELLFLHTLTPQQQIILQECILKLTVDHMPLAYLLGFVPFLDLTIDVAPPILIPRPETEEWVHNVIQALKPHEKEIKNILDIGTGSGCIALALAYGFPQAHVTALDINPEALRLAKSNAEKNNISNFTFLQSDLFSALINNQTFDLIVSNPPYINPDMAQTLSPQVKNWEDPQALFAPDQGLEIIEKILKNSALFLNPSTSLPCQLAIEIDQYHKDAALTLAESAGWDATAQKDCFGNWRTIWCKKT
ncbi:MAG: peptide chain release factor N(5)-glutamine methyltransferase [Candidatus Dependentiae bacterium]|nr:peptide chain release factor N(5)-glutamine methyltransferase [Candidatus Dependentiae bacterium]